MQKRQVEQAPRSGASVVQGRCCLSHNAPAEMPAQKSLSLLTLHSWWPPQGQTEAAMNDASAGALSIGFYVLGTATQPGCALSARFTALRRSGTRLLACSLRGVHIYT